MTGEAMTKTQILQQVSEQWQRLLDVAGGVSEEEQIISGAVGHWAVSEALLHVAAWDEELVNQVEQYRRNGEEADYGDDEAVDRLNQAQVDEKRGLSVAHVWEALRTSHEAMLDFLRGLPEEAFAAHSYIGDQIATETLGHYLEHLEDIERWKASRH